MKKLLVSLIITLSFGLAAQTNNYSLEFDGVDDYVNCVSNVPSTLNSLTIMSWINIGSFSNGYGKIFDLRAGDPRITLQTIQSNSGLGLAITSDSNGIVGAVLPNFNITNTWVHITGVWDGPKISLFVNGTLEVENTQLLINQLNITNTGAIFHIGAKIDLINFFHGKIDDLSFWNIALDSTQIQQYMDCPPNGAESGLIGYWNFEEGTGTASPDITGNGNDGTLTNGPIWSTDVPPDNCDLAINEPTNTKKELVKIIDLTGRETEFKPNTPLILIYSDGTRERVMEIE